MACGACSKRRNNRHRNNDRNDIMNEYKYLTDAQIKARLEVYKKRYCKKCDKRYDCDFVMYTNCNNK